MSLFDKLLSGIKPKKIDTISPTHELYEDLKGNKKNVISCIIISFIIADFFSGFIYYLFARIFDKRMKLIIANCFTHGITKTLWLTLILAILLCIMCFKVYRSQKKDYIKNYEDNYLKSTKETYGGAHFQTDEELRKNFGAYKSIEDTTDEIAGIGDDETIYSIKYTPGMNHNKIYFGAPGSGKSAAIIKTDIFQAFLRGDSIICTDSKGALYNETSPVAHQYGYKVKVLNLKPTEFKNSDGWNLFKTLQADDPTLDAKADVIANSIIKNTSDPKHSQDYWGQNEFNLFKCVVMYVATDPTFVRLGTNTLPEMFQFLSANTPKTLAGIFTNIPKTNPIRQCYDIFANCSEQNQGQIINGACIRLSKLSNQYLQQVLSNDEIDLIEPMKRKCIYYVIIDDSDDSYKFISALFFSSAFNLQCEYSDKLSREERANQLAVCYMLDEYANTGGIHALPIKIATIRSRKLNLTIILQDKGQLDTMYSISEAATILNCCTIKSLLSTNDLATAKYFSDLMGTQTVITENLKVSEDVADIVHAKHNVEKTMGEGKRPLMIPEDFLNGKLKRDELVYVIGGMPPVKLRKYFSEKMGEAIHPLEKECRKLGERKCSRRLPRWRRLLQEKEKMEAQTGNYTEESAQTFPTPTAEGQPVTQSTVETGTTEYAMENKEMLFDDIL